jgi:hypothetical protein
MVMIPFYRPCGACNGTGFRQYNAIPGGPLVEENPCLICSGTGKVLRTHHGLDDTLIQQILTNQAAIIADLDYIHGKVTAIWNKVK